MTDKIQGRIKELTETDFVVIEIISKTEFDPY